ncbi:MAG TPA: bifunctional phosphoribosylaminoimidazolecarboxamide formyltransferase/IMP cyclohydrolase, partial [Segetibacter sp.]|nr:bifunctional phosphoribosylaminoimidazolecarboxamide formyltransferase/IMP cyclohydrolase [Segetibacter sp.]
EKQIIEKIDIGGPSMIRAAAKNFNDLVVIAAKGDYAALEKVLVEQKGETTIDQRKQYAAKAFEVVMKYDMAISNYFNPDKIFSYGSEVAKQPLRYGENPHQKAFFEGELSEVFTQLHGKEISYNNLVDIGAAIELINEFKAYRTEGASTDAVFAIIKHTNVCGIASRATVKEAWDAALEGDPESAFGGVLVCNGEIDKATAEAINEIFFEVIITYDFSPEALEILKKKKNRIILQLTGAVETKEQFKAVVNGVLKQDSDIGNFTEWNEVGGRETTAVERADLEFANIVCKHLKSNAIALVKNKQLIGKGCGQTSRIDAVRQSIEKAKQFEFDLNGAVLASDAFFPFNDSVKIAYGEGIKVFIQPGGSIRDKDSIDYCVENNLAMVFTGMRHFKH